MKILQITSLEHSGSTLLGTLLSGHDDVCALGEYYMLLDDGWRERFFSAKYERVCSCGASVLHCPVWLKLLDFVKTNLSAGFTERVSELLRIIKAEYGEYMNVVVSSDLKTALMMLEGVKTGVLDDVELIQIHLVKDVRSFVTSMKYRYDAKGLRLFRYFKNWQILNRQIEDQLAATQYPTVTVGYEPLCFDTQGTIESICNTAEIGFDEKMLSPRHSRGHVGAGNPMRHDSVKSKQIIYDGRWFSEKMIQTYYLIHPWVAIYNQKLVYRNYL